MARRMFSPDIVDSDAFLEMPISSQALYFHLGMHADDDGFVNPKKIMRMIGVAEDDLKVLLTKRFLLVFQNGVVVIKHWLIHNMIRKDRYHETQYLEQKKTLFIKENMAYTELATNGLPTGNQLATEVRLGKGSIGERTHIDKIDFEEFWKIYPKHVGKQKAKQNWNALKVDDQRKALEDIPKRKVDRKWIGGFIKDPERYIKNEQWNDDIIPEASKEKSTSRVDKFIT